MSKDCLQILNIKVDTQIDDGNWGRRAEAEVRRTINGKDEEFLVYLQTGFDNFCGASKYYYSKKGKREFESDEVYETDEEIKKSGFTKCFKMLEKMIKDVDDFNSVEYLTSIDSTSQKQ